MLIDTHAHMNIMLKKDFDRLLTRSEIDQAASIIQQAELNDVTTFINVGTSLPESLNCIALAQLYDSCFAAIGVHPNDTTASWRDDIKQIEILARQKMEKKIVAIGECGLDFHYPDFDVQRQKDAFKAQIDIALNNDLALIVHTRDAGEETLRVLEEYTNDLKRCIIHCFSEDPDFAQLVLSWGFMLGIGGILTYPKNVQLREIVAHAPLEQIVLETDAPYLPPQTIRGKPNHPLYIKDIAIYIAKLREISFEQVALQTTTNAELTLKLYEHVSALKPYSGKPS